MIHVGRGLTLVGVLFLPAGFSETGFGEQWNSQPT